LRIFEDLSLYTISVSYKYRRPKIKDNLVYLKTDTGNAKNDGGYKQYEYSLNWFALSFE
jgi:hypothetical protein